jgi:hypothetical protein
MEEPVRFPAVEQVRDDGHHVTFHVTKVNRRRWNWVLTMRYVTNDPVTDQERLHKVLLRTGTTREPLDALCAHLEAQAAAASEDERERS